VSGNPAARRDDGEPLKASFKLDAAPGCDGLIDLFGEGYFRLDKGGTVTVELKGYGCRWLRRTSGSTPL
jgi:hypothetical protein